jgi:hypothetical protein
MFVTPQGNNPTHGRIKSNIVLQPSTSPPGTITSPLNQNYQGGQGRLSANGS